jgi:hypothetical protein
VSRDIGFELERFESAGDGRLEVVGRWSGVHGRRLARPVLTVQAAGRRQRLSALPGGQPAVGGDEPWRAAFAWDGDVGEIAGAELEIGRLVVELPAPRRRRRRPAPSRDKLRAEVEELRAEVAELRAEAADPKPDPERTRLEEELQLLRVAHGSLRDAHERLEDELEPLRAAAAERERVTAELGETRTQLERVGEQLERERAVIADLRGKLAAARQESERAQAAEAETTERLRAAREEGEQALAAERAEVARLRESLSARTDEDEAADASRRVAERISLALERERATSRNLQRELDTARAQTAELRRGQPPPGANGAAATEETLVASTPAGRAATARTAPMRGSPVAQRRAEAARVAAAGRVPEPPPSRAAVWGVRAFAALLVALLLVAFVVVVTYIT